VTVTLDVHGGGTYTMTTTAAALTSTTLTSNPVALTQAQLQYQALSTNPTYMSDPANLYVDPATGTTYTAILAGLPGSQAIFAGDDGTMYSTVAGSGVFTPIGSFVSDRRLKENIVAIGRLLNGLTVYVFSYVWDKTTMYIGLMADEVETVHPEAVTTINGIKVVNYELAVK